MPENEEPKNTETPPDDDATGGGNEPENDGEDRTFTQEELDAILGERLARERKKFSDYDDVKAEVERLRKEEQKRAEAEMSEVEKAQAKLQQIQEEKSALENELLDLKLRQAFYEAADNANLQFVSPEARQDALVLALAELEVGDNGDVNADEVIESLQETRPYLFGKKTIPETDGRKRGEKKTKDEIDREELARRFGI